MTLDAYRFDIDNRITLSDQLPASVVSPIFAGTPYANIQSAAFYTNVADTRTDGVELSGNYQLDLQQWGQLNLNAGVSQNNTKITALRDVGNIKGSQIVGRTTQGLIEDGTPETKLILSANWLYDGWGITLSQRRYGEWKSLNATNPTLDQTYSCSIPTRTRLTACSCTVYRNTRSPAPKVPRARSTTPASATTSDGTAGGVLPWQQGVLIRHQSALFIPTPSPAGQLPQGGA